MARDLEARAVELVARRVLRHAIGCVSSSGSSRPAPEDYPALSSDQWIDIVDRAVDLADLLNCTEEEFLGSYEYLTGEKP